jgi:hypothetical protein
MESLPCFGGVTVPHCGGGTGILVSGFKSCIKIRAGSRLAETSVSFNDEAMSTHDLGMGSFSSLMYCLIQKMPKFVKYKKTVLRDKKRLK